jgi:hypothetical protein
MKKDLQTNYSKDIEPSSITPKKIFEQRRQLIQMAALGAFGLLEDYAHHYYAISTRNTT